MRTESLRRADIFNLVFVGVGGGETLRRQKNDRIGRRRAEREGEKANEMSVPTG
jgi:hypothetical protein